MTLPRILIIDDQYYWDKTERNSFLQKTNLAEIKLDTSDDELNALAQAGNFAGVVFCSGQKKLESRIMNSIDEVDRCIQAGWPSKIGWRWSLILLDMYFLSGKIEGALPCGNEDDDAFGLKILDHIIATYPELDFTGHETGNSQMPVIVLSGIDSDVKKQKEPQANAGGALRYVEKKPLNAETIKAILLEDGLIEDDRGIIIGRSLPILKMLRQARQAAIKGRNLLILGKPGSGKTEIAKYVHDYSAPQIPDRFIKYTASSTTEDLQYSELFGCWYGAHSLADRSYPGKAENAHRGTLFIDEIGNLTSGTQAELLEYGRLNHDNMRSIRRLGNYPIAPRTRNEEANDSVLGNLNPESHSISVNVLLVAATNAAINDAAYRRNHNFRDDLYDRLTEYNLPLLVPSLSECAEDIPLLFLHYLEKETELIDGILPKQISSDVFSILKKCEWPGNVSGLKSIAAHVAWEARYYTDVYVRHLPPLQKQTEENIIPSSVIPHFNATLVKELEHQVTELQNKLSAQRSIEDLQSILDSIPIPKDKEGLKGILPKLNESISDFLQKVLINALLVTKDFEGEYDIAEAGSLLINKKIGTSPAYDIIKKICKLLDKNPSAHDPLVQEILERAIKNRPSKKKKHSTK